MGLGLLEDDLPHSKEDTKAKTEGHTPELWVRGLPRICSLLQLVVMDAEGDFGAFSFTEFVFFSFLEVSLKNLEALI